MNINFVTGDITPYYVYATKDCVTPIRNRARHALCLNASGHGKITFFDGSVIETFAGDIILLPKNSSYHIEVYEPYDSFNIAFSLTDEVDLTPFVFHAQNDPKLCERFKTILNIWQTQKIGYKENSFSEFYQIIRTMKQHYFSDYLPTAKHDIIKPAIEYIHSHYTSGNINVDKLALICNVSPRYLRTIFKNLYGVSPAQYITNLQTSHAKQLIDSGAYSISEISNMLGFSEPSQFSRKFKTETGISPSQYLRSKAQH